MEEVPMKTTLLSCWIVLLLCSPVLADDASRRATALRILETTNVKESVDQVMDAMESMLSQQLSTMDLSVEGREAAARMQAEMMSFMAEAMTWEDLRDFMVDTYSELFTEQELLGLAEFYESDLGQKMIARQPEIMQRSMSWSQQAIQERMPELQRRIEAARRELAEEYGSGTNDG
jgi:hypothetical protein